MTDKRAEVCIGTEVQQVGLAVSNQKDARDFARIARLMECVAETGNAKKPRIGLRAKAYKGRMTVFELDCNICGE